MSRALALALPLETTMSQTNYVVVMTTLMAVVEVTNGNYGVVTSQTNGVVATMALVVVVATCGDDGVMSQTSCLVVTMAPAVVVMICGDDGVMSQTC